MAKGNILGILNVDDYYEPGLLNKVYQIFPNTSEPSLIVGNCNVWSDSGQLLRVNKPQKMSFMSLILNGVFPVNPSAYFYHKSLHDLIGWYDIDEHYAMDLDFLIRAIQIAKVKYVNEPWGNFRLHENSKTFRDIKSHQTYLRVDKILEIHRSKLPFYQRFALANIYKLKKSGDSLNHFADIKQ